MIHGQQLIGSPGELHEGDACYVPASLTDAMSQGLRLVDCHDFTHFLDDTIYTEATVVMGPPKSDFRKVTFSGEAIIEFSTCSVDGCAEINISGYDNHEPNCQVAALFAICHVSPIAVAGQPANREDDVHIAQTQLCANGAGLDFNAHCTLMPDNRTVHVTGAIKFFVDDEHTCGANDEVAHTEFDALVPEDGGADLYSQKQLPALRRLLCPFPESCNDNATVSATVFNKRDD